MTGPADPNHATLTETYALVDRTRQDISDRIDAFGDKFDAFVTSNEHRLTVVETHQAAQAQAMTEVSQRLDIHGKKIGTLEDQQRADEAATKALETARTSRWTLREQLLTLVLTATLAAGAILGLILH